MSKPVKEIINFEDTMKELEKITLELERGDLNLDESIEMFEKGMKLSKECNKYLQEIEKKITILIQKENEVVEENFE